MAHQDHGQERNEQGFSVQFKILLAVIGLVVIALILKAGGIL